MSDYFINHFVTNYYLKVLFLHYVSLETLKVADEFANVLTTVAGRPKVNPLCLVMCLVMIMNGVLLYYISKGNEISVVSMLQNST